MLNIYHQGSNPIILPKGAALTKLIIKHYHEEVLQHTLQVDTTRYEISKKILLPASSMPNQSNNKELSSVQNQPTKTAVLKNGTYPKIQIPNK